MHRFMTPCLSMLAILILASPAAALKPVDDFEVGPFFFQTTGGYQQHTVTVADYAGHMYDMTRRIKLQPATGSDNIAVQLALSGADDALEATFVGGGYVNIGFDWGLPFDVTENGLYDRVEVAYRNVSPDAFFSFYIGDDNTVCANERFPDAGPGVVSWPLDFCADTVDPTAATLLGVRLVSNGDDATFEVTDIRLLRSDAIIADITREFVATMVPPIPSPPLTWTTFDPSDLALYHVGLVFEDVDNGGYVPEASANLVREEFHGGALVRSNLAWLDFVEPGNVNFRLTMDLMPGDGWTPSITYPPDPIHGPTDVTVATGVTLTDNSGLARGTSLMRFAIAADPVQDYAFTDVQVQVSDAGGLPQNRLEISFRLEANAPFLAEEPLLDITWFADWQDSGTLTGVLAPDDRALGAPTLVAMPNLTSSTTRLRASRPFARGETVAIFDVAGRLVRQFAPSIGAQSLVWDGRDRFGATVASGTYLAQWRGVTGPGAVAKVVKLR